MIRDAHPGDLPAILVIEQSAPTAAHWKETMYESMFADPDHRHVVLVAEAAGKIAGFLVAASAGAEWELENIVVESALRGGGLGAQLLQALVENARAAGAMELHAEIRASNPALAFYQRLGFEEIGRRTKYYTLPQEDAILIKLLISRP